MTNLRDRLITTTSDRLPPPKLPNYYKKIMSSENPKKLAEEAIVSNLIKNPSYKYKLKGFTRAEIKEIKINVKARLAAFS